MARTEVATKSETFSNRVISKMAFEIMDEIGAAVWKSENYKAAVKHQYPNHRISPGSPFPPSQCEVIWREGKSRYQLTHEANYPQDRMRIRQRRLNLTRVDDRATQGPPASLNLYSSFEELTDEKHFQTGPNPGYIVMVTREEGHSHNDRNTLARMKKEFPIAFPKPKARSVSK